MTILPDKTKFKQKNKPTRHIPPLGFGFLVAAAAFLAGTLLLTLLFCFTDLNSSTAHALQLPVLGVAAFAGAMASARRAGKKGLIHGLRLAALLLVLVVIINLAGGSTPGIAALLIKGIIIFCGAALGGIAGVF